MAAWTQDEIQYLKENYSTASKEEILKHVRHSWNGILSICSKLCVRRINPGYIDPERRAVIDNVLLEKYSWSEIGQLEKELKISRTTVDRYAHELGLQRLPAPLRKRIQLEKSIRSES